MIALPPYHGRKVAVLGLARSGLSAARALADAGAEVLAWDDSESARKLAADSGIALCDLARSDAGRWSSLVMSPGIPLTVKPHPVAARAKAAGVPVIGDIELLWQAETGARFIGITGTNGKSTTTALIGHVLETAGKPAAIGGNLGTPVLSLPELEIGGSYVIEMSSFQLDLIQDTHFDVAILLNVTPDHLDRHGDMAGYVAAKGRIFRHQGPRDTAIIGVDDDYSRDVAASLDRQGMRVVQISAERSLPGGIHAETGLLVDATGAAPACVMDLRSIATLPGRHNWQNAAAAYAACRAAGLGAAEIVKGIATYPGLPHRQELVGRLGKVRFINDSKATNADAAAKALGCYERIHWIAGGVPKEGGIASLTPFFPRIARAYLIGQAADDFAVTLGDAVPVEMSGDLATAIASAARAAASDAAAAPVVLLSPACASFDQFKNFEIRGDTFRCLAAELVAGRTA